MKFSLLSQSFGLLKLMLNLVCTSNIAGPGREICWCDFMKYLTWSCVRTFVNILCVKLGMMLDTGTLYSLCPVWMTLTLFTQGHRLMGKIELLQSFCWNFAWSSWSVCDSWLCKGDDCEEVLSVWWISIVWAFALLVETVCLQKVSSLLWAVWNSALSSSFTIYCYLRCPEVHLKASVYYQELRCADVFSHKIYERLAANLTKW